MRCAGGVRPSRARRPHRQVPAVPPSTRSSLTAAQLVSALRARYQESVLPGSRWVGNPVAPWRRGRVPA